RRHQVFASAAQLRVVVREDRRYGTEVEPLDGAEGKVLYRKARGHTPGADRFGALRQDRSETLRRPAKDADAGVELVSEAGRRRRQRHGHQMVDERRVELVEVELKIAGEVRAVR